MSVVTDTRFYPWEKELWFFKIVQKSCSFWSYFPNLDYFQNSFRGIKGAHRWHKNFINRVFVLDQLFGHHDHFFDFSPYFGPKTWKIHISEMCLVWAKFFPDMNYRYIGCPNTIWIKNICRPRCAHNVDYTKSKPLRYSLLEEWKMPSITPPPYPFVSESRC